MMTKNSDMLPCPECDIQPSLVIKRIHELKRMRCCFSCFRCGANLTTDLKYDVSVGELEMVQLAWGKWNKYIGSSTPNVPRGDVGFEYGD